MFRKLLRKLFVTLALSLAAISMLAWLVLARPFVLPTTLSAPALRADPQELQRHVEKLSVEFFPRDWTHTENLDRTAAYLQDELKKSSSKVYLQTFPVADKHYSNVVAEYGPSDAAEVIVVGAHYDACDKLPAADDNASGVAGVLELGRLLAHEKLSTKVLLVAYTLEEPPFFRTSHMGSAVHAASLAKAGVKVRLMISLEMIGYFSDAPLSQKYPIPLLHLFYPSRGNFIAIVGGMTLSSATIDMKKAFARSVSLPAYSLNAPALVPGVDSSDHMSYWAHGFDAIMVSDTAFLRNSEYHRAGDVAERLNYEKMAEVVDGVLSYLTFRPTS